MLTGFDYRKRESGFTLVELAVYIGIFSVIAALMLGVFVNVIKIHKQQGSGTEISGQINFIKERIADLISRSSLIEIPDGIDVSVIKLRMADASDDPTFIGLRNGAIELREGSGASTTLTTSRAIATTLNFKKIVNYPGKDIVQYTIALQDANDPNIIRTSQASVGRLSTALFNSAILPDADNSRSIGSQVAKWLNALFVGDASVAGKLSMGTSTASNALNIDGTTSNSGFSVGYENFAPLNGLILPGFLGLGVLSPAYKLEVAGNVMIDQGQLRMGSYPSNPEAIGLGSMYYNTTDNKFYYYDGSGWAEVSVGGGSGEEWTTSGNDIYNSNSGNVGIGLQSPIQKLTLSGNLAVVSTSTESGFAIVNNLSTGEDYLYSIATDDLYIYVAGFGSCKVGESNCPPTPNHEWRIEKRDKTTGALVTSFDGDGIVRSNPTAYGDYAYSIAVDASYIYVVGMEYCAVGGFNCSSRNYEWRIEKRDKTTGALVTSFDGDGAVTSNPSTGDDYAYSVAADSSYIYVAGYENGAKWRIEKRDKTTGALVTSFDGDGVVTSDPSPGGDYAWSIAIDSSYIYVVGSEWCAPGGPNCSFYNIGWRIEKRDKTTGALVASFDGDGVVTSNPSTGSDYAKSIAIDSSYIFITGFAKCIAGDQNCPYPYNDEWRIEKRDKATGALVASFDGDGAVKNNPSIYADQAHSIAIDSAYVYVVGYDSSLGLMDQRWRIEKRDKTTGALVTSFDGDGVVTSNPDASFDHAYSVAIDSSYIYAAGFDFCIPGIPNCQNPNIEGRIEKRALDSGSIGVGTSYDAFLFIDNNNKKALIGSASTSQFFIPSNDADFIVNGSVRIGEGGTIINKMQTGEIGGLSAGQAGSSGTAYFQTKFSRTPMIYLVVDESIDNNGATKCRVTAKSAESFNYYCYGAADGIFWTAIEP